MIHRKKDRTGSTPIDRRLLQDSSISFETLGMLCYLLSHADTWEITLHDIERQGGIKAARRQRMMREAEQAGYLERRECRTSGKVTYRTDLHEIPLPPERRTSLRCNHRPQSKPPQPARPQTEKPSAAKRTADGKPACGKPARSRTADGKPACGNAASAPVKAFKTKRKEVSPQAENPFAVQPQPGVPQAGKPQAGKPQTEKPQTENPLAAINKLHACELHTCELHESEKHEIPETWDQKREVKTKHADPPADADGLPPAAQPEDSLSAPSGCGCTTPESAAGAPGNEQAAPESELTRARWTCAAQPALPSLQPGLSANRELHLWHRWCASCFGHYWQQRYQPQRWRCREADAVRLHELIRAHQEITFRDWRIAIRNYLATPQARHTLADLAQRYEVFRAHPLNQFKQPQAGYQERPTDGLTPAEIAQLFEHRERQALRYNATCRIQELMRRRLLYNEAPDEWEVEWCNRLLAGEFDPLQYPRAYQYRREYYARRGLSVPAQTPEAQAQLAQILAAAGQAGLPVMEVSQWQN
jgi:hypothetical protein